MTSIHTKSNPVVVKKYANRRLYNTVTSSYVTLDDLCKMIKDGDEIIVYDAKNGDDITRGVLTQVIVEQESKGGQNLLPTSFLRQLIGFYGNSMQGLVPRYLDHAMQSFSNNQDQMRDYFRTAMGGAFTFNAFEEMSKQNMSMFEQAMKMFSPFTQGMNSPVMNMGMTGMSASQNNAAHAPAAASTASAPPAPEPEMEEEKTADSSSSQVTEAQVTEAIDEMVIEEDESIRAMQQRLDELQKQIASLSVKEGE